MKLSKREFTLVIVLGVVLSSIFYYKYIIVPQTAVAASATMKRDQKRNELAKFKADMASKQKLKAELIKLQKDLNIESESYFLTLDQEEIILILTEFAKDTNVKVDAINFEEPRVEILEEEEVEEETAVNSSKETKEKTEVTKEKKDKESKETSSETKVTVEGEEDESESDNLDVYTVDLEYESSYASLLELLKVITNYDKRIMIKDININKEEIENQNIKGNIILDFYVIGKILGEEDSIYAWGSQPGSLLADPFSKFMGYYKPKSENSTQEENNQISTESSSTSTTVTEENNNQSNGNTNTQNSSNSSGGGSESGNLSSSPNSTSTQSNSNNTNTGNASGSNNSGNNTNTQKPTSPSKPENNVKPIESSKPTNPGNNGSVSEPNKPSGPIDSEKSEDQPKEAIKDLFNFEDTNLLTFGPVISENIIKGEITLNKDKKIEGESSLNLKYDFLEKRRHNTAGIMFEKGIEIEKQAKRLSLSVQPIERTNCSLRLLIEDGKGEEYTLLLTNNLDWNGWQTLLVDLPIHINYPATVKGIYVESRGHYQKLTGDLLMDDLKLIYVTE